MKTRNIVILRLFVLLALCAMFLGGCTVKDTIYLQNVSVSGPINLPPIHINADAQPVEFRISPHVSLGNEQQVGGHVEGSGSANKYATSYKNLSWNVSGSNFGADGDLTLSRVVALTFGMSSSAANGESFFGGHAGLGLLFHGEAISGRFDGGVQCQTIDYDAATVVEREVTPLFSSSSTTIGYFRDAGNSLLFDYYLSLTLNSKEQQWPINVFGQLALSKQSLTNFYPHNEVVFNPLFPVVTHVVVDTRAQSSATFLIFTPGIYLNLGNSTRLLAGVRIAKETEIADNTADVIFMPLVQFDIKL